MTKQEYWKRVRQRAKELGSDGCTGVLDFYLDACLEHDIAYMTQHTVLGERVTRAQADRRFRQCIQSLSPLGVFSPLSWWRWVGVRIGGKAIWNRRWKAPRPLTKKEKLSEIQAV